MADEDLVVPTDVPWQLLSRREPSPAEDPTTVTTFVYVPELATLDESYPTDRLVYLKFTVSVFPFHIDAPAKSPVDVLDEAYAPVWRMIFDIQIDANPASSNPGLKPYFLSAAPTRRAIIETGVVGDHITEGESDELAVARSGSQLIEGFHSSTKTRHFGVGGFGAGLLGGVLLGASGSYTRGSTSIAGGREVSEQLDTTNREASTERKELLSHMTNVNNVLTLLNGSLVGTNKLHFSLWPQPLRPLSIDPNDESLWYAELLKRRSSGIEGMQDFYAIAVVPRGEGFCISENVRRVSVLEPPLPEPPTQPFELFDQFHFDWPDYEKVFVYLAGKYPQGTPLEELDVSVEDKLVLDLSMIPPFPAVIDRSDFEGWYNAVGQIFSPNPLPPVPLHVPPPQFDLNDINDKMRLNEWAGLAREALASIKIDLMPRPVVSGWSFWGASPPDMFQLHALTKPPSRPIPYKFVQDVWLEATQYEYEAELAKSPLERGAVLIDDREVHICADVDEDGSISGVVTKVPATGISLLPISALDPGALFPRSKSVGIPDPQLRGRAMVATWGLFERQLGNIVSQAQKGSSVPLTFAEPRLARVFLGRASRLSMNDKRNRSLSELATAFGLSQAQVGELRKHGVTNLSSLAGEILRSQDAEKLAARPLASQNKISAQVKQRAQRGVLESTFVKKVIASIADALDSSFHRPDRGRATRRRRQNRPKARIRAKAKGRRSSKTR
jgi:hypothetical protein